MLYRPMVLDTWVTWVSRRQRDDYWSLSVYGLSYFQGQLTLSRFPVLAKQIAYNTWWNFISDSYQVHWSVEYLLSTMQSILRFWSLYWTDRSSPPNQLTIRFVVVYVTWYVIQKVGYTFIYIFILIIRLSCSFGEVILKLMKIGHSILDLII